MIKGIARLILQDLKLDFREKYALGAILLYLVTTVYIVYRLFVSLSSETWLGIYWIIFLLVALSLVLRSFVLPGTGLNMYYYSLYHPLQYLIAKIGYNLLLLLSLGIILFLLLAMLTSHPVEDLWLFGWALFLASAGVSVIFSFVSAIAARQAQNSVLMAVLALPLIIPILMLVLHISGSSVMVVIDLSVRDEISLASGLILLMSGLSLLLFPNIWRS